MADDKPLHMALDPSKRQLGQQDDYLDDPEMEGLTLYEKKALLVNRELNSHGMGENHLVVDKTVVLFGSIQITWETLTQ